ncbi:MAG: Gfo/Idh/MocA family oxidoreductase [Candidatus Omnitrophica bacterium]|nr:Gfo/Idh/MocA family oxidoreductase [Candidatus Omnitrophota bacterium]
MERLKCGVVGLGRIGWSTHCKKIQEREDLELVCVVDPLAERREEAITTFKTKVFSTIEEAIGNLNLDLLVIASPSKFHAEQTIKALNAGIHVLVEKPMAETLKEVDEMIAISKKKGKVLAVHQQHHFAADYIQLREILDSGILGKIYRIVYRSYRFARRSDWQSLKRMGGGTLSNTGPHGIDMLLGILGGKAELLFADLRKVATVGDAEDVVILLFKGEKGELVEFESNSAAAFPEPNWYIMGESGTLIYQDSTFRIKHFNPDKLMPLSADDSLAVKGRTYDNKDRIPWQEETIPLDQTKSLDFYDNLVAAIYGKEKLRVPLEDIREQIRLINEAKKISGFYVGNIS